MQKAAQAAGEAPPEQTDEEKKEFAQDAEHNAYQKLFSRMMFGMTSINVNKMAIHEK